MSASFIKHGSATWKALDYLMGVGSAPADLVGYAVWGDKKRHTTSNGGGGDYGAQMLLGRLRKRGLVCVANTDGSSRWQITQVGREAYSYCVRA